MLGEWLTPRGNPRNLGRSEVAGTYMGTPVQSWQAFTGADIRYARTVRHPEGPAVLVQAGTTLQLHDWSGEQRWAEATLGVRSVLFGGQLSPDGPTIALVILDERTVAVVDLVDGSVVWTWESPPSSSLSLASSSQLFRATDGGMRWVCFPRYATLGACFDLANPLAPTLKWQVDFDNTYDTGFGPHVIVTDIYGTGVPHVVISSRTGSAYRVDGDTQQTTSAQLVLGREDGHLYQAILDADSGQITDEVRYRPDPGDYPCARPYGLLQAVAVEGNRQDIVLVSCQVEEYFAVTRHDHHGLARRWGAFVEKDRPEDRLELRPQVSSIADLNGEGHPDLVVGFWDGEHWTTKIIDLAQGLDQGTRAELANRYFWGCEDIDGDGRPELIVSDERRRTPGRVSRLEVRDGETLEVKASLDDAGLVLSGDSELPPHVGFLANRQSLVVVTGSRAGILVRVDGAIASWGGTDGSIGLRHIIEDEFDRADVHDGELILSDTGGRVVRFDTDLRRTATISGVQGRTCQPLVWRRGERPELVLDVGGGRVVGSRFGDEPEGLDVAWEVTGTLPALHRDADERCRLAVADNTDPHQPQLRIHTAPGSAAHSVVDVSLRAPATIALTPFGEPYRLLADLRTGVHTAALLVVDASGQRCWDDPEVGSHPQRPGVAPTPSGPLVVADDHGLLRIYDGMDGGLLGETDWTAAYTVPIAIPDGTGEGTAMILRVDGIHGTETLDLSGTRGWRLEADLWAYFRGSSAVGRVGEERRWALGTLTRDGRFDLIDVEAGTLRWSLEVGDVLPDRAVAAGDLDGDGADEFILGTRDGHLVCLAEDRSGRGVVRWTVLLPGSVTNPVIADLDGDGTAKILVSTADGAVRVLSSNGTDALAVA